MLYSQVLSGILISGDRAILFACIFFVYILREVKCKFIIVYIYIKRLSVLLSVLFFFWSTVLGKYQIFNFPNGDLPVGHIFHGFSHWFSTKIKNCIIQKHLNLKVVGQKQKIWLLTFTLWHNKNKRIWNIKHKLKWLASLLGSLTGTFIILILWIYLFLLTLLWIFPKNRYE